MEKEFSVLPVITKKDNPEISMSVINITGIGRYVANLENTSAYICVKGAVTFMMNKDGTFLRRDLTPGQRIKIPPETPYFDFSEEGGTLIAINKKAFDQAQVVELPMPEMLAHQLRVKSLLG